MKSEELYEVLAYVSEKFPDDFEAVGEDFVKELIQAEFEVIDHSGISIAPFDLYEMYSGMIAAASLYIAFQTYRKSGSKESAKIYERKVKLVLKNKSLNKEFVLQIEERVEKNIK